MPKIKLLILGYSSFVQRRILPAIKKIKKIDYYICSKSQKINIKKRIFYNNYNEGLKRVSPHLVYISLINSLHFSYAKKMLRSGFNVIVDKPITSSLKQTKELLKIAKNKKLLLAEATLFNFHNVFNEMIRLSNGIQNIEHIQSNFNVPKINKIKTKGDCEEDMSPYAASVIRLFTNNKIKKIEVYKNYINNNKYVKNFYVVAKLKKCLYFGNFGQGTEYKSQISFFTKNRIIVSPNRAFALPPDKNVFISLKEKDKLKKILIKKDDCIQNFILLVLNALKKKRFNTFYRNLLVDSMLRNKIKKNNHGK